MLTDRAAVPTPHFGQRAHGHSRTVSCRRLSSGLVRIPSVRTTTRGCRRRQRKARRRSRHRDPSRRLRRFNGQCLHLRWAVYNGRSLRPHWVVHRCHRGRHRLHLNQEHHLEHCRHCYRVWQSRQNWDRSTCPFRQSRNQARGNLL